MSGRSSGIVFGLVAALCLALVGWWVLFQSLESAKLERAAALLAIGDSQAAARALGASDDRTLVERAEGRRLMFVAEGAAMGLVVVVGVIVFYGAWRRERRLRQERERFLCGATHELKTPLATLRLGLETLLGDRVAAERRPTYLRAMVAEVGRLERDVDDLLAAAGLRTGARPFEPQAGDLVEDVRSVVSERAQSYADAGVALRLDAPGVVTVWRDGRAVRLLTQSLLDNALKYSRPGGHVDVAITCEGPRAVLRVVDDGLGMTAEECERAFDELYRGPDKERFGGAGIGLYLVRQLAEMHGGQASARSDGPGSGSELKVELPLGRKRRAAAAAGWSS